MTRTELLRAAKPMLLDTDSIIAILDSRKTQMRLPISPQPNDLLKRCEDCDPINGCDSFDPDNIAKTILGRDNARCYRHYRKGDILYVRETWAECQDGYAYKADVRDGIYSYPESSIDKWRPSTHMPKEAARIFLKVTDVRVERLRNITESGARAEGCITYHDKISDDSFDKVVAFDLTARAAYREQWNTRYAKKGYSWDTNPWVWVYDFEKVEETDNYLWQPLPEPPKEGRNEMS